MENKDKLRTLLRRLINKQIYQFGADFMNAIQVTRSQGFQTYRLLHRRKTGNEHYRSVYFKGYSYPIYFRPETPDVGALIQNLVREEYGHLPVHFEPQLVIDAGSYIGDVSIYFLNRFRNSRVVALEPNKDSYELSKLNLKRYFERVDLINKGLWSHEAKLKLSGLFTGSKITDNQDSAQEIACVDIRTLTETYGIKQIDILKLDIEGAEQQVILQNSDKWLQSTKIIIVEFHGKEIKELCTEHLMDAGYEGYQYRSLYYFFNKKIG